MPLLRLPDFAPLGLLPGLRGPAFQGRDTMNARELERYFRRELGMSRKRSKIAVAEAVKDGTVQRFRPGLFTRICNALTGKNTSQVGTGGKRDV